MMMGKLLMSVYFCWVLEVFSAEWALSGVGGWFGLGRCLLVADAECAFSCTAVLLCKPLHCSLW